MVGYISPRFMLNPLLWRIRESLDSEDPTILLGPALRQGVSPIRFSLLWRDDGFELVARMESWTSALLLADNLEVLTQAARSETSPDWLPLGRNQAPLYR